MDLPTRPRDASVGYGIAHRRNSSGSYPEERSVQSHHTHNAHNANYTDLSHAHHNSPTRPNAASTSARTRRGSGEQSKQLACSSCRKRKIKCQPDLDGGRCRACLRSGTECLIPAVDERKLSNSKKLVRELYAKIASLEAELLSHRHAAQPPPCAARENTGRDIVRDIPRNIRRDSFHHVIGIDDRNTPECDEFVDPVATSSPGSQSDRSGGAASLSLEYVIIRLCGGYRHLNSNCVSQPRYNGPTWSLNLAESVASSVLSRSKATTQPSHNGGRVVWQDIVSESLQDHLFELYWKYQHQVIPIIHKEAFLQDFKSGQTGYCSKLLVHCILARAAAISDRPDIRALALVADEVNDDSPLLVRRCTDLLNAERNHPGITTLQSLELLSEIYGVVNNETKGWMYADQASRLAFELGLHSDMEGFHSDQATATSLTPMEREVRQTCFWGCFSFDRQWALYSGRPQMIKLDDVTVQKPRPSVAGGNMASLEPRMSVAWADLLEIVGILCDALNGAQTTRHRVAALDRSFRDWYTNLDAEFRYNPQQIPAVFHLHMQYSAAVILLHRPLAQFGAEPTPHAIAYGPYSSHNRPSPKETSRQICIQHACLIAQYLQQYEECHGSLRTLSWVTLHMISTAAATLIATLSERRDTPGSNTPYLVSSLQMCIRTLGALEESHLPTRRVRKLFLHAMRLLNLESMLASVARTTETAGAPATLMSPSMSPSSPPFVAPIHTPAGTWAPASLDMPIGGIWAGETHSAMHAEAATFDEFLPPDHYVSHTEMLLSFESLLY
ncbi:uncharacterized protein SPSK_01495 [Sporothrix schenckii 1099-18]|uniref:Zn(2)-C6 fungal-type domain-containing protein n=1 Tax=Sporothrix schenckii 1099-18 TaxID=1397361 RepID=A0A0F2MD17_SPOSC|nr:uncharacterized protein SPSK_01495 [Sporothrix schenckii 1099-18]KJR87588.1 hypothetical protein SPSK_01495 [Sporothrix schenckii 1099-18]